MKAGDKVLIMATITQNTNGNEIRCETATTKQIVWCVPEEIKKIEDRKDNR